MKTELSSRRPASNTQLSIKQLFNVHDVISHVKKNQHCDLNVTVTPCSSLVFSIAKLILHYEMSNESKVKSR